MGLGVCMGALAQCPFGMIPTPLTFTQPTLLGPAGQFGTCLDIAPFVNIKPFGLCKSLLNPTTAALTVASAGVLTPGPCIPTPAGIWIPTKPTLLSSNGFMLTSDSMLICAFGGIIKIIMPAQFQVMM